ncbi:MAG: DUF2304 domain-containing protein [Eubacterium sp.]|nr:DUF2304 domain-containing protein [Eubacterium sp.]
MLRVLLIVFSLLAFSYVILRIRRSQMQIEYSIFWIIFSLLLIIIAIFPQIIYKCSQLLHIMSAANFVFLFIITVMLIKIFMMTIELSALENKVKDLVQQLAINEKKQNDSISEKIGQNNNA